MKYNKHSLILWILIAVILYLIFFGSHPSNNIQEDKNHLFTAERDVEMAHALKNLNEDNYEQVEPKQPHDEHQEFDMKYFMFLVNKTFPKTGDVRFSGFNETLSHSIPLDRIGEDIRPAECTKKNWKFSSDLKVSVVIPFVNEPWSTLLRTVISVLIKSPKQQIIEVILVDDQSDRAYLLEPLERLISAFKLLRLVRTPFHMGVARSRNYGARHAVGSVILFLDSHCEVNVGWMEPLLEAITEEPTRIAVCTKNHILPSSLKILGTDPNSYQIVFNWRLGAAFDAFRPDLLEKYNMTDPLPQVSLMGQVIAVNKQYFWGIGGFPDYFDGWGAEDVDISIKSWLCGGGVVKCRCCQITHLQKIRPYKIQNNPQINVRYIADLWLDEFKPTFQCTTTAFGSIIDSSVLLQARALKEKLKCKPFRWLLENVYPELEVPQANTTYIDPYTSEGQLPMRVDRDMTTIRFSVFHYSYCSIQVTGSRIKCRDRCLTFDEASVKFAACESETKNQMWSYETFVIRPLFNKELCLGKSKENLAIMEPCKDSPLKIQFWTQFKANCLK